jgi:diphosphomevalonate decarboxylase
MGNASNEWKDSRAIPIASRESWPDLETLILVANDAKKDTSSTEGMDQSVKTSLLLSFRAKQVVNDRLERIEKAFKERDFATFGELAMADSNQFHATCLDTFPPIFYLNDTSRQIIRLVHAFNKFHGKVVAAYTFDAGPNAVIFVPKEHHQLLTAFMLHFFPASSSPSFSNRPDILKAASQMQGPEFDRLIAAGAVTGRVPKPGDVKMMYCTRIGDGPRRLLDPADCLIGDNGFPIKQPAVPAEEEAQEVEKTENNLTDKEVHRLHDKVDALERLVVSQHRSIVQLSIRHELGYKLIKMVLFTKVLALGWKFRSFFGFEPKKF